MTWCFAGPRSPWRCRLPRAPPVRASPAAGTHPAGSIARALPAREWRLLIPYIENYRYIAACQRGSCAGLVSGHQRGGKSGDQVDEIGLAAGAGFVEQAADRRVDRGVGGAKGGMGPGETPEVDDGKRHAQRGLRPFMSPT